MRAIILAQALASVALAQQGAWWQCGGINYNGGTKCIAGYSCNYVNDYYYQCQPGSASPTTLQTVAKPTTTTSQAPTSVKIVVPPTSTADCTDDEPSSTTAAATSSTIVVGVANPTGVSAPKGKFKWLGASEAGAEFGYGIPGTWGVDFIFASTDSIDTLMNQGYNIFRMPFKMERMVPNSLNGPIANDYYNNYSAVVNHITQRGGWAILDPHNYGRYYDNIITDTAGFQAWWKTVASMFASNNHVIFDTNNEFHDMDQTLVYNLNQAAINGIRAAGAKTQYIFVEGNAWSGAAYWASTNDNLKNLVDSSNKIVYEMHLYLDSDGSGTSSDCVSGTIGAERLADATTWLRQNNKHGVIGEFAGGANSQCMQAVTGLLDAMHAATDVWLGGLWWAGGPWWHNYLYGFEPGVSTIGYDYYNPTLLEYAP